MRPTSDVAHAIRARGGKVTPQRRLLYDLLQKDHSHPSAEDVFQRMREVMPTVSLTTVYKSLNELVGMGELKRFAVDGVTRFDPNTELHAETVCSQCGRIDDVDIRSGLSRNCLKDFRPGAVIIYGLCATCQTSQESRWVPQNPEPAVTKSHA